MGNTCSQEDEMDALGMDCFCKRDGRGEHTQMVAVQTVKTPSPAAPGSSSASSSHLQPAFDSRSPQKTPAKAFARKEETPVSILVDPTSPSMHQASAFGDIDTILHELDNGWHVDMTDKHGRTALHHAALNGNSHVAKLLIDRGARLDARSWDGKTPFNYAAENCKAETLRYLDFRAQERKKMVTHAQRSMPHLNSATPRQPTPPPSDNAPGTSGHTSATPPVQRHQDSAFSPGKPQREDSGVGEREREMRRQMRSTQSPEAARPPAYPSPSAHSHNNLTSNSGNGGRGSVTVTPVQNSAHGRGADSDRGSVGYAMVDRRAARLDSQRLAATSHSGNGPGSASQSDLNGFGSPAQAPTHWQHPTSADASFGARTQPARLRSPRLEDELQSEWGGVSLTRDPRGFPLAGQSGQWAGAGAGQGNGGLSQPGQAPMEQMRGLGLASETQILNSSNQF